MAYYRESSRGCWEECLFHLCWVKHCLYVCRYTVARGLLVGLSFDDWFGNESSILKSSVPGYQDHPDILRPSVLVYESGHLKFAAYALAAFVASLWTVHLLIVEWSFLISCDSFWFEVCFIRCQDSYANWFQLLLTWRLLPSFGSQPQPLSFQISELCFLETTDSWILFFFFFKSSHQSTYLSWWLQAICIYYWEMFVDYCNVCLFPC